MPIKSDTFVIPALFAVVAVASPVVLHAQEVERAGAAYESRFAETPDLRLQYMDFGGSGQPVIFVQDFPNYFDSEFDSEWPGFYARFADDYRVLAPIRRGYGESDDTGCAFYIQGSRLSRAVFEEAVRDIMSSVRESSFEVRDPEVEVFGPDAALVSFQWSEATVDTDGSTADQAGAITLVYERREGEWLIVQAHESLRPAP